MRTIYFIRHGQPESSGGCGGCATGGLNAIGRHQAQRLGQYLQAKCPAALFTSPLPRCVQTAQAISGGSIPVWEEPALREVDTGLWEGLSFDEIKRRFPAEYAARGAHMGTVPPPGGESFCDAGARVEHCIARLLNETSGNLAIVGHGGAGRAWLCRVMGIPMDDVFSLRQPWGGVTVLETSADAMTVQCLGLKPDPFPADMEIEALLAREATPEPVRAHARAVAKTALAMVPAHSQVDCGLLRAACLLHDMARPKGAAHAAIAAKILDAAGWPGLADIVAQHHDLGASPSMEAKLLYLADKLTLGETPVTLDVRFAKSREKCRSAEALAAWQARYDCAVAIGNELQGVTP